MQGAVAHEVLGKEDPVTLPQELECEVQVTPTPQLPGVQITAPQVSVFRLGSGEHVGLVFGLEDEELPPVFLQDLHHPLLALQGVFGDIHRRMPQPVVPASLPHTRPVHEIRAKRHLRTILRDLLVEGVLRDGRFFNIWGTIA